MSTTVIAVKCPECKMTIFSRAQHDMRWCKCGTVAVDGGLQCDRLVGDIGRVSRFELIVEQTERELFDDWNAYGDKYGHISG